MKTLSQLRALAAATVGASVSPFAEVVLQSTWSKTLWACVFLFPRTHIRCAYSFARSAGRCRVSNEGAWVHVKAQIPAPAVAVWPASLVCTQKRVRWCRIEGGWRAAEEKVVPARHQRQEHAQAEYRQWRRGYSSGLSAPGFPV